MASKRPAPPSDVLPLHGQGVGAIIRSAAQRQAEITAQQDSNEATKQNSTIDLQQNNFVDTSQSSAVATKALQRSFRMGRETYLQFERIYNTFRMRYPESKITHDDIMAAIIALADNDVADNPIEGEVARAVARTIATKQRSKIAS